MMRRRRVALARKVERSKHGDRYRGRRAQQEEVAHRAQVRERVPQAPRQAVQVPRPPHGFRSEQDDPEEAVHVKNEPTPALAVQAREVHEGQGHRQDRGDRRHGDG